MIQSVKGYQIGMEVRDADGWLCKIKSFPTRSSVTLDSIDGEWSHSKCSIATIAPTIKASTFTHEFRLITNVGDEDYEYIHLKFKSNREINKYFSTMVDDFNKDLRGASPRTFIKVQRRIGSTFITI